MSLKFRMTPQGMKSMYNLAWSKGQPQLDAEVQAGQAFPEETPAQEAGADESERLLAEPFLAQPFPAQPLIVGADAIPADVEGVAARMQRMEDERPLHLLWLGYVF